MIRCLMALACLIAIPSTAVAEDPATVPDAVAVEKAALVERRSELVAECDALMNACTTARADYERSARLIIDIDKAPQTSGLNATWASMRQDAERQMTSSTTTAQQTGPLLIKVRVELQRIKADLAEIAAYETRRAEEAEQRAASVIGTLRTTGDLDGMFGNTGLDANLRGGIGGLVGAGAPMPEPEPVELPEPFRTCFPDAFDPKS